MAKLTPTEFQEKWAKRLKGASVEMKDGVNKVKVAPSKLAIAKQEKMKANLIKAIEDGVWAASLGKVTLEKWKDDMLKKGVPRVSAGVDGAKEKMQHFASWLFTRLDAAQAEIAGMPDITLEDNIARMTAHVRKMAEESYKE